MKDVVEGKALDFKGVLGDFMGQVRERITWFASYEKATSGKLKPTTLRGADAVKASYAALKEMSAPESRNLDSLNLVGIHHWVLDDAQRAEVKGWRDAIFQASGSQAPKAAAASASSSSMGPESKAASSAKSKSANSAVDAMARALFFKR